MQWVACSIIFCRRMRVTNLFADRCSRWIAEKVLMAVCLTTYPRISPRMVTSARCNCLKRRRAIIFPRSLLLIIWTARCKLQYAILHARMRKDAFNLFRT